MKWRAWYDAEPRGEDRLDQLFAYLAASVPFTASTSWKYHHRAIRDMWTPLTDTEKKRRRRARKLALKKKMAVQGQAFKAVAEAKGKAKRGVQ